MTFQKRSIEECLDIYRSTGSKKLKEQENGHYIEGKAWSFSNLDEWPEQGPVNSLYLFNKGDIEITEDHNRLVEFCNFQAVGVWNANGEGRAITVLEEYQLVDVELVQEQADDDYYNPADYVNIIYAIWVVNEGVAVAIWNSNDSKTLAKIIGIKYPTSGWSSVTVWHGE